MPDITDPVNTGPILLPEIEAAIEYWFNTHIAGSPVARSVEAYNHLRSTLGALGTAIAAIREI